METDPYPTPDQSEASDPSPTPGRLIVLSGASGSGKSTLVDRLLDRPGMPADPAVDLGHDPRPSPWRGRRASTTTSCPSPVRSRTRPGRSSWNGPRSTATLLRDAAEPGQPDAGARLERDPRHRRPGGDAGPRKSARRTPDLRPGPQLRCPRSNGSDPEGPTTRRPSNFAWQQRPARGYDGRPATTTKSPTTTSTGPSTNSPPS